MEEKKEGEKEREGSTKMMKEKKEFHKGEFSGFGCVFECSETWCVFSTWLHSLFIFTGVDLGMRAHAQHALLA